MHGRRSQAGMDRFWWVRSSPEPHAAPQRLQAASSHLSLWRRNTSRDTLTPTLITMVTPDHWGSDEQPLMVCLSFQSVAIFTTSSTSGECGRWHSQSDTWLWIKGATGHMTLHPKALSGWRLGGLGTLVESWKENSLSLSHVLLDKLMHSASLFFSSSRSRDVETKTKIYKYI